MLQMLMRETAKAMGEQRCPNLTRRRRNLVSDQRPGYRWRENLLSGEARDDGTGGRRTQMAYIPKDAMRQKRLDKLTPAAWDLYGYYCEFRNHRTGYSFPSDELLFQEFGMPLGTIKNAQTELKTKKWLVHTEAGFFLLVGDFSPVTKGDSPTPPEGKKYIRGRNPNSWIQEFQIPESRNLGVEIPESRNPNSWIQEFPYKGVTSRLNQDKKLASRVSAKEEKYAQEFFSKWQRLPQEAADDSFREAMASRPEWELVNHKKLAWEFTLRAKTQTCGVYVAFLETAKRGAETQRATRPAGDTFAPATGEDIAPPATDERLTDERLREMAELFEHGQRQGWFSSADECVESAIACYGDSLHPEDVERFRTILQEKENANDSISHTSD
jgi:hypothetical protein